MKVVIIGAGPAGLSCAYELCKKGVEVEIFEASNYIGGMSRSFDLWGQRVDLGPHRFFSKEKHVNGFFKEIVQEEYTLVNRLTRIYYRRRFFQYPLRLMNVLTNLNLFTITRILWDYFIQRVNPIENPTTLEEWITNRFGKKLFEIFFKNYSEKLWGISCSQIDADWAAQRIKTLSLLEAVIASVKGNGGKKHKTLVDQFAYPKEGTGMLYEKCADRIGEMNGRIHLNSAIKRVLIDSSGKTSGVQLTDGRVVEADIVVSTMPFTALIKGFDNVPLKVNKAVSQLYFRNTILVYLEVDGVDLFKDNWIYVHSPDVKHGRITNFRNWCPSLTKGKNTTILCIEFWAFENDEIWSMDESSISKIAEEEIRTIKIIPENMKVLRNSVLRVPKCYPVYETGYQKHLKVLENYIDEIDNLIPIGRYGSFKYNNQDHSILMGILAAEKITENSKINLWDINTDTEYQEEGKIKDVLHQ